MTDLIYAKSAANGGTLLTDHTKMVLNLMYSVLRHYETSDEAYIKECMVAAILHDIGKCTESFQTSVKNNGEIDDEGLEIPISKKITPITYHNTVSWAFGRSCINGIKSIFGNPYKHSKITSAVLYHHTVRNDDSLKSEEIIQYLMDNDPQAINRMSEFYYEMCQYVKDTFNIDILANDDYTLISEPENYHIGYALSDEKLFTDNTKYNLIGYYYNDVALTLKLRASLVYADRTVSSREYDNERILNNDDDYIWSLYENTINKDELTPDFSSYTDKDRLNAQFQTVLDCYNNTDVNTNVIGASAGFGKTLMGLMTFLTYKKKTFWVLPTIELCNATYNSILEELDTLKLNDKVSVGLYYSNHFVNGNVDNDIIVIGIDALLSRLSKNNLAGLLINSLTANVIFDEYHEFIGNEPLFAGFIHLVKTRKDYFNSNTFLLSATPLNLNNLWGSTNIKYWLDMPIYGSDINVEIHFKEYESIQYAPIELLPNSLSIMPTVDIAQITYINAPTESLLLHSRFNPEDRKEKMRLVFDTYGKHSTISDKKPLIGTNIIGTGFNISARNINDYIITPMGTIQTLGRASRFKEYDTVTYNVLSSSLQCDKGVKLLIEESASKTIRTQWLKTLQSYDNQTITKKQLYDIYNDFMNQFKDEWNNYILYTFKNSAKALMNIRYASGNYKKSDNDKLNKAFTYRGENSSFYATVKLDDNSYLEPIICDTNLLYREDITDDNVKDRYDFMTSGNFHFPNKDVLKYKWKIQKKGDATTDKCLTLALSNKTPLLLCNFNYNHNLGLYRTIISE